MTSSFWALRYIAFPRRGFGGLMLNQSDRCLAEWRCWTHVHPVTTGPGSVLVTVLIIDGIRIGWRNADPTKVGRGVAWVSASQTYFMNDPIFSQKRWVSQCHSCLTLSSCSFLCFTHEQPPIKSNGDEKKHSKLKMAATVVETHGSFLRENLTENQLFDSTWDRKNCSLTLRPY